MTTTTTDPGQYLRRRMAANAALATLLRHGGRTPFDEAPSGVRLLVNQCDGAFGQVDTGQPHGPLANPATEFGNVEVRPHGVTIEATGAQLYAWANRPGARWVCSHLEDLDSIRVNFDASGLVDFTASEASARWDLPADEFNAWSSDVLRDVLPADHPAYPVTVGQFI